MTPPVWLIAGREFRAYVATLSFWIALALGPVIMAGGGLLMAHQPAASPSTQSLTLTPGRDGILDAHFSDGFPLSQSGRAQILKDLAQDPALHAPVRAVVADRGRPIDVGAISRFVLVMILWMTLAGSLGMLLQATVRERASRALESLLAAASPWDVVSGKLIGVGGVSMLVVAAWLGSTSALALFASHAVGLTGALLHGLDQPALLLRAAGIYLTAFAFYGLTTVAIGARARDSADAQNLARPMFALLLAVFFAALLSAGGGAFGPSWLVFLPPFTPFLLLLHPQSAGVEALAMSFLAVATVAAGWLAVQAMTLDPSPHRMRAPQAA